MVVFKHQINVQEWESPSRAHAAKFVSEVLLHHCCKRTKAFQWGCGRTEGSLRNIGLLILSLVLPKYQTILVWMEMTSNWITQMPARTLTAPDKHMHRLDGSQGREQWKAQLNVAFPGRFQCPKCQDQESKEQTNYNGSLTCKKTSSGANIWMAVTDEVLWKER